MSIKTKNLLLLLSIIVVFSIVLAFFAPNKARDMAKDMLYKDAEFISNILADNMALGLQTLVIDNGAAIEQALESVNSGASNAANLKTINDVIVFDADLNFVRSLTKNKPSETPSKHDKLTFEEKEHEIISYMPMKDQSNAVVGYLQINFSKSFLDRKSVV